MCPHTYIPPYQLMDAAVMLRAGPSISSSVSLGILARRAPNSESRFTPLTCSLVNPSSGHMYKAALHADQLMPGMELRCRVVSLGQRSNRSGRKAPVSTWTGLLPCSYDGSSDDCAPFVTFESSSNCTCSSCAPLFVISERPTSVVDDVFSSLNLRRPAPTFSAKLARTLSLAPSPESDTSL